MIASARSELFGPGATAVLNGRVALVTGGASGIGRATAQVLSDLGATIVIADLDGAGAAESVVGLRGSSAQPHQAITTDLSLRPDTEAVVPELVRQFGRIDILVNSAGLAPPGGLLDTSVDTWERVQRVNLTAPFILMAQAADRMRAQGEGGYIVNVSSSSAFRARWVAAAYAASKAGLLGLTRVASGDLAPFGINVNAVAPGVTETPMTLEAHGDTSALQRLVEAGPMSNLFGRVSTPDDVAHVITFLCTPFARQITGQTIHVSAGAVV